MVIDGKKRTFVPYKGWCVDNMGHPVSHYSMQLS